MKFCCWFFVTKKKRSLHISIKSQRRRDFYAFWRACFFRWHFNLGDIRSWNCDRFFLHEIVVQLFEMNSLYRFFGCCCCGCRETTREKKNKYGGNLFEKYGIQIKGTKFYERQKKVSNDYRSQFSIEHTPFFFDQLNSTERSARELISYRACKSQFICHNCLKFSFGFVSFIFDDWWTLYTQCVNRTVALYCTVSKYK